MFFCRTKYQKAVHRILKKANYRMRKELDITNIIRKAREANNLAASYATSNCFVPPDLRKEYESHHSNAVHISLRTD